MTNIATSQEAQQIQRDLDFARYQLREMEEDFQQMEKNREAPPTYLKRKQLALKNEIAALQEDLEGAQ